jgi:hypothetical protein
MGSFGSTSQSRRTFRALKREQKARDLSVRLSVSGAEWFGKVFKIHADRLAGFWTPQEINRVLTLDRLVAEIASAIIDHLHRYIELLFEPAKRRGKEIS